MKKQTPIIDLSESPEFVKLTDEIARSNKPRIVSGTGGKLFILKPITEKKQVQRKRKNIDTSGKKALKKLLEMNITGGDDPYLSENIDHYLYGTPKKRA